LYSSPQAFLVQETGHSILDHELEATKCGAELASHKLTRKLKPPQDRQGLGPGEGSCFIVHNSSVQDKVAFEELPDPPADSLFLPAKILLVFKRCLGPSCPPDAG